jgi:hypothetical protein
MTTITGNTFPVKEQLKALGAHWNKDAKGWDVPDAKADDARKLVASAPASAPNGNGAKQPLSKTDIIAIAVRKRGGRPGICSMCGEKCKYPYGECWDCKEERDMGY